MQTVLRNILHIWEVIYMYIKESEQLNQCKSNLGIKGFQFCEAKHHIVCYNSGNKQNQKLILEVSIKQGVLIVLLV